MKIIDHLEYGDAIKKLEAAVKDLDFDTVYGIPRGGQYPAAMLAQDMGKKLIFSPSEVDGKTLVVDDLCDSGATIEKFRKDHPDSKFAVVYLKDGGKDYPWLSHGTTVDGDWLVFPDEHDGGIEENAKRILQYIGEDVTREGLVETPKRMRRAWDEIFAGYKTDPHDLVKTFVQGTCKEMVILKNCEFYSTCVIGSTLVETPSGRMPISKLKDGDWVYTFDENADRFTVKKCVNPRLIKKNAELVEVYTEKDTLYCTPDHKILTFKGWKEAKDLKTGDRIVSMQRGCIKVDGAMRPYLMFSNQVHKEVAEHKFVYESLFGSTKGHIHHIDHNPVNNAPENLTRLTASQHSKLHAVVDRRGELLDKSKWTDEQRLRYEKNRKEGLFRLHNCKDSPEYKRMIARRSASVKESWRKRKEAINHKVIAVRKVEWREDVWCMDVPDTHNFVAQGMVIHNCEHHFFPFFGHCSIGYIPNKKVIGVSKLARLLDCYSKRMQIQERMTTQIADFLEQELEARGVYVVCEGQHFCMTSRGVKKQDASMVTSAIRGEFMENAAMRAEFLSLVGLK